MSFGIVSEIRDLRDLASPPKAVLLALALRSDDERRCWPSLRTIASDAGYGLTATKCALAQLEEWDLVRRERRTGVSSGPESTLYEIATDLPGLVARRPTVATRPTVARRPTPRSPHGQGVGRETAGGRPPRGHEDPLKIHLEDPSEDPRAPQRSKRGTRLSPDWQPDEELTAFARSNGVVDVGAFTAEFRDYWIAIPGQRGTKLDWPATFRNWIRRTADRRGRGVGSFRAPLAATNKKQPLVGQPDWMRLPSERKEQQLEL